MSPPWRSSPLLMNITTTQAHTFMANGDMPMAMMFFTMWLFNP